jgi:hypothetical protein
MYDRLPACLRLPSATPQPPTSFATRDISRKQADAFQTAGSEGPRYEVDAVPLCTYRSDVLVNVTISERKAGESARILAPSGQLVTRDSSPDAKIQLFRSLFRGRTDVFPIRFESLKTGRSGYSTACANEWVRGVCEKPRIKCADCPNRRFIPVSEEIIRWHLSGRDSQGGDFVMGVYPMLHDETCHFLAADFDRERT